MASNNYYNKIVILFIAAFANVFIMWYFLIRPEGLDWVSSQIVHQASPYVVSAAGDGRIIVDNALADYGLKLPENFQTAGARNLTFFLEEDGRRVCEIKHYYVLADQARAAADSGGVRVILSGEIKLVFKLMGGEVEKAACAQYLKQITTYSTMD